MGSCQRDDPSRVLQTSSDVYTQHGILVHDELSSGTLAEGLRFHTHTGKYSVDGTEMQLYCAFSKVTTFLRQKQRRNRLL